MTENLDSTKQSLIAAAKRVFARCGFDGSSVRIIAEEAGVNMGAVSYHFAGKEGLYRAVIEPIAEKMTRVATQALKRPVSAVDFRIRLELFIEQFFSCQAEEPETVQILQRDFPGSNEIAEDVFRRSFRPVHDSLHGFFQAAFDAKIIKSTFEPELATTLLISTLSGLSRMDIIRSKEGRAAFLSAKNLSSTIHALLSLFCEGIITEDQR